MKKIDRTGDIHGRLTVIKEIGRKESGKRLRTYWLCECICGNKIELVADNIKQTKSCGCLHKESTASINLSHGFLSNGNLPVEYKTWTAIKNRCYNINSPKYKIYGGIGIMVCDRWLNSFENFIIDMGKRPPEFTSIDRIDNKGHYEPSNCRWADAKTQANNTSRNVLLTYNGITLNIKQWAEKLGYNYKSFYSKIKYQGFTLEQLQHGNILNSI